MKIVDRNDITHSFLSFYFPEIKTINNELKFNLYNGLMACVNKLKEYNKWIADVAYTEDLKSQEQNQAYLYGRDESSFSSFYEK